MIAISLPFGMDRVSSLKRADISAAPAIPNILRNTMGGIKMRKIKQTQHGFHGTPLYGIWAGIVKRCEGVNSQNYKYYGGRGIKICKQWRENAGEFCKWAISNGYEDGLEIDRIDNDGDYNPQNCHFITHAENLELLTHNVHRGKVECPYCRKEFTIR